MNKKAAKAAVLAAFIVLALGGLYYARAQMGGGMGGMGGGPGQRMGGMNPQLGMRPGGMNCSSMVVFGKHIYVMSGPRLIKVDPVAMKVVGSLLVGGPAAAVRGGGQGPDAQSAPQGGQDEMPEDMGNMGD
jgi:hypothetical protein